jgi:tetratricopeptide (TPR) repeat protein
MGAVFEAVDRDSGARVALKTLKAPNPDALFYLKNEFRTLQDVRHENLVQLLELIEEDGRFFVTMELVEGSDFLAYTRPGSVDPTLSGLTETRLTKRRPEHASIPTAGAEPLATERFDEARLRRALGQLAEGIAALHERGKVHRDVKPANVLVTPGGRVVLVDFGLTADAREPRVERGGVGTRAFMAPEQAAGQRVTSAADWYSVGVVVYLALTGSLPFHGSDLERKKLGVKPLPARNLCPEAPEDLANLAADLLDPDPAQRPDGRAVLGRLGLGYQARAAASGTTFLGRDRELATLLDAFSRSRAHSVTALVVGDSGLGKSTLVREMIARLAKSQPEALVLSGRCYERELVPYKAFDGIVDAMSHYLQDLAEGDAARLIPPDAAILTRIFPVLERVPALGGASRTDATDPQELRARAFTVLRELFRRMGRARPVLLFIDDLQWADADSHLLLGDLFRPPDSPALCLVATARPSEGGGSDPIAGLSERLDDVIRLPLSPLSFEESRALASDVLGARHDLELAASIARETRGHPLFVQALAEHAKSHGGIESGALRLEDALVARVAEVPPEARRVLELLSVAGAPLPARTITLAAELDPSAYATHVASLRVARLVRTPSGDPEGQIEPYHDRVRETVLARLETADRRARHGSIAEALEASGRATLDPQAVVRHLEGAGRTRDAARKAELAAERAESALAFDQAAELYRTAVRLGPADEAASHALRVSLARTLTNAGRAAEASSTYLELAASAKPERRLEYRRQAADHMLRSGHIEQGTAILSGVLQELGDDLTSQRRSLVTTVLQRVRLRIRGLGWTPRKATDVPEAVLRRIDAYHAVGVSLALIDPIRGSAFEARALRLALEAGDPLRLAPILVMEAGYEASVGARGIERARRMVEEVDRIAVETADPYVMALERMIEGFIDYHEGKFAVAAENLERMEGEFRALPGTYFEQVFCHCFAKICTRNRGLFGELQDGFFDWTRDAERRGDRFTEASLRLNLNGVWLARDEPGEALRDLERVSWIPPEGGYHVQHWYERQARAEIALYTGESRPGLDLFRGAMKALSRSFILRMRLHRSHARWLLGRLILQNAENHRSARTALDEVLHIARKLESEKVGFARS